jgi:hypothetical protein
VRALLFVALLVAACSGPVAPAPTPRTTAAFGVVTAVPNGRVEIVVKPVYAAGEEVRAIVRLSPSSGTLHGPLEPFVQASGFAGTAVVRHLAPPTVTASEGRTVESELRWDGKDDAGRTVPGDDYTLVLAVIDDQGRRSTAAATIVINAP